MTTTTTPDERPAASRPPCASALLLLWALAPLACLGGQGETTTGASTSTESASSASDGKTSTSGKSTGEGSTQGSDTQGTGTTEPAGGSATDTQGTDTQGTGPTCNFVGCDMDIPRSDYCGYHDELCPEGSKCSFDGTFSETACFDLVPMPDGFEEPCEASETFPGGMDSCGYELLCWQGQCAPFCDWDDFSCPPGYACSWCQDCALGVCLSQCDPLLQDCQDGDTCVPDDEGFTCVVDASGDQGAYGDPCEFINACDPGLTCVSADYVPECDAASCCSPFCDLESPQCPDDALECIPWYEEGQAPPGKEPIGLCGIPQP